MAQEASPEASRERGNTLSAIVLMACTAASRLFGFLKQALIGYYFGASGPADVLNVVFAIPNSLRKLFAEGAFSSAFIPVLSTAITEDRTGEKPRTLVRSLVAFQLLLLVPLVGLSLAFPRFIVDVLFHFPDASKAPIAAQLFRWMFNYTLFVSLSALIMAALNAHGNFAVPALAPLVFSLAIVLAIVLFGRRFGVIAMGGGVLVGGALQLLFLLPAFARKGYDLRLDFRFSSPEFATTLKLWVPYLLSASIFAINQVVAQYFASGLEDGSASAIANSTMFLQLPIGIFTASVYTVLFPQMSRQAASSDTEGLRASVSHGLELLVTLLIPSTVLLCLFGKEVIAAALQRGRFDQQNTLMAARALTGYALGLVCLGLYNFLQRFFYSLKSFMVPLVSAAIVAAVDVALSLILKGTVLRVAGLAYANSIAFTAGLIFLIVKARKSLGSLGGGRVFSAAGKSIVASIPMSLLIILFVRAKPDLWTNGGTVVSVAWAAAVVVASVVLTLIMFLALGVPVLSVFSRKRRRA